MIGIQTHLVSDVSNGVQAGATPVCQVLDPLMGIGRGPHPDHFTHRPEPAPEHVRMDTPCKRIGPCISDIPIVVLSHHVFRGIDFLCAESRPGLGTPGFFVVGLKVLVPIDGI